MTGRGAKLVVLSAAFLASTLVSAQRAVIRIHESEEPITISLSHPADADFGYRVVTFRVKGRATVITPKNPVACAPADASDRKRDLDWSDIKGMMLDPSLCFHRAEFGGETKHSVLAFMSKGGASDAAPALVIAFQNDGTPYKVLERDELDLLAFEPSSTEDAARIIGMPTLPQFMAGDGESGSKGPYATTYDPRAVYIVHPGEHAQYSPAGSQAYNEQKYVWAGPKAREDYAVVYNYPGRHKPFGIAAKRLDELFAKLQENKKP